MTWLRALIFGCVTVGALAFTPAAQADRWQKSSDGYWYYWSDNDQRWYYQDGKKWQVLQNGQWVDAPGPSMQSDNYYQPGYRSYYYEPDTYYYDGYYGGYNRGYGGYGGSYWGSPGIYFGWGDGGRGYYGGRGWGGGRGRR